MYQLFNFGGLLAQLVNIVGAEDTLHNGGEGGQQRILPAEEGRGGQHPRKRQSNANPAQGDGNQGIREPPGLLEPHADKVQHGHQNEQFRAYICFCVQGGPLLHDC